MKSFLRAVLNFLDRKFPDKVVLKIEDVKALEDRIKRLEEATGELDDIKASINRFNVAMGFMPAKPGAVLER